MWSERYLKDSKSSTGCQINSHVLKNECSGQLSNTKKPRTPQKPKSQEYFLVSPLVKCGTLGSIKPPDHFLHSHSLSPYFSYSLVCKYPGVSFTCELREQLRTVLSTVLSHKGRQKKPGWTGTRMMERKHYKEGEKQLMIWSRLSHNAMGMWCQW